MKEIKIEKSITNRNADSLDRYLQDISRYPLLNAEEESTLAKKVRLGDKAALQKLVNCNLRFVVSVAKKYELPDMSLADLISEGNIGLVKAAERFDESKGFKFISYAVWWIRQAILHSMGLNKRMIRLPMNQVKGVMDLLRSEDLLEQRLHRSPTLWEQAIFMDVPYEQALDYLSNSGRTFSLDVPVDDAEGMPVISSMNDPMCRLPDEALEQEALKITIGLMMKTLTTREQRILCLAYGMEGNRPLQNDDISDVLGLSSETIRRSKQKALFRLRELKGIEIMQEYLQT